MPTHFAVPFILLVVAIRLESAWASFPAEQSSTPHVELSVVSRRDKYVVTQEIRVEGKVSQEGVPANTSLFEWSVFESDSSMASDGMVLSTYGPLPSLVISPNVLQPAKHYSVRLIATMPSSSAQVNMSAEMRIETAGGLSRGSFQVSPSNGTATTRRVFSAHGWSAEDYPLSYTFGYIDGRGRQVYLTGPPLTVYGLSSRLGEAGWAAIPEEAPELHEIEELPEGDPLSDYALAVFVDVCTSYGSCSIARREVHSRPVGGTATPSFLSPVPRGRMVRSATSSVQLQAHPQLGLLALLVLCAACPSRMLT